MTLSRILYSSGLLWRFFVTQTWYRLMFQHIGHRSVVYRFTMLIGAERIRVGRNVLVRPGCRLETIDHGQPWQPSINIGDDVNIEQNVHIVCHDRIVIGNRVSIAGHCAIVDVSHPADRGPGAKTGRGVAMERSFVEIGENSFIGFGSIILPNVKIGRDCVVGAGSVVTRDVPDAATVAGVPARIIAGRTAIVFPSDS